ncbi:hypothetical protein I79_018673 [Cricetulus griseus]|uniref:Uncharacterized protein n=1 Tax=Cricetulus griseus TaxID=10029 RepID=G3I5C9_CRIGR|nr:hypothetical protein I79_018673 [Cricetulus griseus]
MITASVVLVGSLKNLPEYHWCSGSRQPRRLLGPAVGRERPLMHQDQVLPITMKSPHLHSVTLEALCSVHCGSCSRIPCLCLEPSSSGTRILKATVIPGMNHNVQFRGP